jgi:hypothetical protein
VTPAFVKMLRRCDSTVFWLRNSSAAISGLVLRWTRELGRPTMRTHGELNPAAVAAVVAAGLA